MHFTKSLTQVTLKIITRSDSVMRSNILNCLYLEFSSIKGKTVSETSVTACKNSGLLGFLLDILSIKVC